MERYIHLSEDQNLSFDEEYHHPEELAGKVSLIRDWLGEPAAILDLGGGNGVFLDALLVAFSQATGVNLDLSPQLLQLNRPHTRKILRNAAIEKLTDELGSPFDLITINYVLHHLVSRSYRGSRSNAVSTLDNCRKLLDRGGLVVVAEVIYHGFGASNLPGHLIHGITRVDDKRFVSISRRYFNTAGVGVAFRSKAAWRSVFRDAGFQVVAEQDGHRSCPTLKRRLAMSVLGISQVYTRHFYLRPVSG